MTNEIVTTTANNALELSTEMTAEQFIVVQDEKGKHKRQIASYSAFASIVPETQEQKIAMFNLLQGDEDDDNGAIAMKEAVGTTITLVDAILRPYDSVDEDTGEVKGGVITYLFDKDGHIYVTSSKSVYFTLKQLFGAFGLPHYGEGEELKVTITKKKGANGDIINLKLVA